MKTEAGQRTLALSALAVAALERHRARLGAVPHPERLVFTVSGVLGHSSPAVTLAIYSHALPSRMRETAERVDALYRATGRNPAG